MFISIEGPDKAGKTTQIDLLKKYSEENGLDWVFTRNPGATHLGQRLRDIVLDEDQPISDIAELMIYLADRADFVDHELKPLLEQGKVVICDRYIDSTVVYQGYGRHIDIPTIERINKLVTEGISPELTILLMVSEQEAARRCDGQKDRLENQNKLFFRRVRNGYNTEARKHPTRIKTIEVDNLSIEEVHEKVIGLINQVLANNKETVT